MMELADKHIKTFIINILKDLNENKNIMTKDGEDFFFKCDLWSWQAYLGGKINRMGLISN